MRNLPGCRRAPGFATSAFLSTVSRPDGEFNGGSFPANLRTGFRFFFVAFVSLCFNSILMADLKQIAPYLYEIPKTGGMRVPGRVYATRELMESQKADEAIQQVRNVAYLPGIVGHSLAMPDFHWGYGFPI